MGRELIHHEAVGVNLEDVDFSSEERSGRRPLEMPVSPRSEASSQGTPGRRTRSRQAAASPAAAKSPASARSATKSPGAKSLRSTPSRQGRENREPAGASRSPSLRALPTSPDGSAAREASEAGSELSSRLHYSPQTERSHRSPRSPASQLRSYSRLSQGTRGGGGAGGGFARGRPDLDSHARHHRQVQLPAGQPLGQPLGGGGGGDPDATAAGTGAPGGPAAQVYIWGTRICVEEVQASFRDFVKTFTLSGAPAEDEALTKDAVGEVDMDPNRPFYMQRLEEIAVTEDAHLDLNLQHVRDFQESLYRRILSYPADIIPYLDMILNDIFYGEFPDAELRFPIEIRPFNAAQTTNMRALNPEDIDQLITVTGMVIRSSALIPEMRQGFFQCSVCNERQEVEVDRGRIEEPTVCRNCSNNHCYQLLHNRSVFMDKQVVKLQESPDDMPAGQTPQTVSLFAHGNLVDAVQPGDRVTVTGIYRAVPLRLNPRMRTVNAVYKTHLDVLHFRRFQPDQLHQEGDGAGLTTARLEQIRELAKRPDVYQRLAHALAPSIFGHEDIKKGILCLLMGGTKKDLTAAGRSSSRAELNVLLCGDPGTSKSQLLQYVHHLVPRSQYTSGKGSSAVGLTAYVTRDPDTKHFVLQTGALVLSDNGVCCIDEFDKMSDATRSVLHEVMEQQTLSIAKAGIICQLNARASILAAANPVDSQWNKDKTIVENVQLSHTLLSRFDLIFLLVDPQDEAYDRRLASHLVSLYYKSSEEVAGEGLDRALIRDYVAFAKANVEPSLSEEAAALLVEKYIAMRKVGAGRGAVGAYPRQLESLIRLAEAHAKVHLRETVVREDVEEAERLHREALKQSAMDPATGRIDVSILSSGASASARKATEELANAVQAHMAAKPRGTRFAVGRLLQDMRSGSDRYLNKELFEEALAHLKKLDTIERTKDTVFLR